MWYCWKITLNVVFPTLIPVDIYCHKVFCNLENKVTKHFWSNTFVLAPDANIHGPVVHPGSNLLLKYADDLTLSIPVKSTVLNSLAMQEVGNIQQWACKNRMKLNLSKTWCSVLHYLSVTIVTLYPVRHDRYMIVKVHSYVKVVLLIPSIVLWI